MKTSSKLKRQVFLNKGTRHTYDPRKAIEKSNMQRMIKSKSDAKIMTYIDLTSRHS